MPNRAAVPQAYRQLFFVNAGGPSRKIVSREVVEKKWQLVTLDCTHRILLPGYQKSARIGCGFCGGLEPMAQEQTGGSVIPTKNLQERERELQLLLAAPGGREKLQELASRYGAASGKLKPAGTSTITYILVHEREQGLIRG
jgi:hypothetical protein